MADPTTVTGLVYRWRADSIAQTNGSAVSSWAALAGGIALTQATTANQPTYLTSGIGGQPSVHFVTASTQSMAAASALTGQSQPYTVTCIFRTSRTDATLQNPWNLGSFVGAQLIIASSVGYDDWAGTDLFGGTLDTSSHVNTFVVNSTSSLNVLDGTTLASGDSGTNASGTTLTVGNHTAATPTRYLDGDIAELLIYSQALNATDRSTVHTYVQDLYGITVADYVAATPPTLQRHQPSRARLGRASTR